MFNQIRARGVLSVCPKESRVKSLTYEIDGIVKANKLTPSYAARIIGKFGFINDQMFGRVGRAATGALRARQYQTAGLHLLTPELRASLGLLKAFLQSAPPRELVLKGRSASPTILYTDASDVPGRACGQYIVGALLISPLSPTLLFTYLVVPPEVVDNWIPKKT